MLKLRRVTLVELAKIANTQSNLKEKLAKTKNKILCKLQARVKLLDPSYQPHHKVLIFNITKIQILTRPT